MKINTQSHKRTFKGLTLFFVLCALVITWLPFSASAASSTMLMCEVTATINVRELPTLKSDIVTQYTAGTKFQGSAEDYVAYADGYYWYWCPDGYIAQTGGLRFYETTVYWDSISGYDAYGQEVWSHECSGSVGLDPVSSNWGYTIDCLDDGYTVTCDCGWFKWCPISFELDPDTGGFKYVFAGLDTDGDEQIDLRPGVKKKLPNRANSDLRPYRILEFLDDPIKDPPTITLIFRKPLSTSIIAYYTFNWSVDIHVEPYGIVMVGNDGTRVVHYADGDFMLFDMQLGYYLSDKPHTYEGNKSNGSIGNMVNPQRYHQFAEFELGAPGDGRYGVVEDVIDDLRDIFTDIPNFFEDFGGIDNVFTDQDSPLTQLTGGGILSRVQQVFSVVQTFLSTLPTPLLAVVGSIFILSVILGVFKLFHA